MEGSTLLRLGPSSVQLPLQKVQADIPRTAQERGAGRPLHLKLISDSRDPEVRPVVSDCSAPCPDTCKDWEMGDVLKLPIKSMFVPFGITL